MKKKLFLGLLAAAAVSFTACQKDEVLNEVQQDNAIGFGTYVGRDAQTKADVATIETLEEGFGVFAYHTGIGNDKKYNQNESVPNYMFNQKVYYENSNWTYQPTKYWPSTTDQISFIAYAPHMDYSNSTINIDNITKGDPTLTFTVPTVVTNQIDLLYDAQLDKVQSNGKIKFLFKHALSKIGFKIKASNHNEKVTVSCISLNGKFASTGKMNVKTGIFDDQTLTYPTDINSNYTLNFNTNSSYVEGTTANEITATEGFIMIIPKDFRDEVDDYDDISITVDYTLAVKDPKINGEYTTPITYKAIGTITDFNFEPGNGYTFVLTLKAKNSIEFEEPEIDPWVEQSGTGNTPTVQ